MKTKENLVISILFCFLFILAYLLGTFFHLPVTINDLFMVLIAPITVFGFLYFSETACHLRGEPHRKRNDSADRSRQPVLSFFFSVLLLVLSVWAVVHGLTEPLGEFSSRYGTTHGYAFLLMGVACACIAFFISGFDRTVAKYLRTRNSQVNKEKGPLRCPSCRLLSPQGTIVCDCGYDFLTKTSPPKIRTPAWLWLLDLLFLLYMFHLPLFLIIVSRPIALGSRYSKNVTLSGWLVLLFLLTPIGLLIYRHSWRSKLGVKTHSSVAIGVGLAFTYFGRSVLDGFLVGFIVFWPDLARFIFHLLD